MYPTLPDFIDLVCPSVPKDGVSCVLGVEGFEWVGHDREDE